MNAGLTGLRLKFKKEDILSEVLGRSEGGATEGFEAAIDEEVLDGFSATGAGIGAEERDFIISSWEEESIADAPKAKSLRDQASTPSGTGSSSVTQNQSSFFCFKPLINCFAVIPSLISTSVSANPQWPLMDHLRQSNK